MHTTAQNIPLVDCGWTVKGTKAENGRSLPVAAFLPHQDEKYFDKASIKRIKLRTSTKSRRLVALDRPKALAPL